MAPLPELTQDDNGPSNRIINRFSGSGHPDSVARKIAAAQRRTPDAGRLVENRSECKLAVRRYALAGGEPAAARLRRGVIGTVQA